MPRFFINALLAVIGIGIALMFVCAFAGPQALENASATLIGAPLRSAAIVFAFIVIAVAFRHPVLRSFSWEGGGLSIRVTRWGQLLYLGGLLLVASLLSGCAGTLAGAGAIREAYCNGVSTGGRVALAQLATGQPVPVIRCDPETLNPGATPAPVVVATPPTPVEVPPAAIAPPVAVLAEPVDPVV